MLNHLSLQVSHKGLFSAKKTIKSSFFVIIVLVGYIFHTYLLIFDFCCFLDHLWWVQRNMSDDWHFFCFILSLPFICASIFITNFLNIEIRLFSSYIYIYIYTHARTHARTQIKEKELLCSNDNNNTKKVLTEVSPPPSSGGECVRRRRRSMGRWLAIVWRTYSHPWEIFFAFLKSYSPNLFIFYKFMIIYVFP